MKSTGTTDPRRFTLTPHAFSPDRYGFAKEVAEEEPAAAAAATPSGAKLEDLKERYLGSTKSPSKVTHPAQKPNTHNHDPGMSTLCKVQASPAAGGAAAAAPGSSVSALRARLNKVKGVK